MEGIVEVKAYDLNGEITAYDKFTSKDSNRKIYKRLSKTAVLPIGELLIFFNGETLFVFEENATLPVGCYMCTGYPRKKLKNNRKLNFGKRLFRKRNTLLRKEFPLDFNVIPEEDGSEI